MSVSISIKAYSGKDSPEFRKHYNAVQFCVENELSYPKETSNFFKGKIDECDLEDYSKEYILEKIENGIEIPLKMNREQYGNEFRIKKIDIPDCVDEIIIKLD